MQSVLQNWPAKFGFNQNTILEIHLACDMQDITIPASSTINFSYHSSVHNLYVGSSPCAYTTEICPAKDAAAVSTSSPCKYSPGKAGMLPGPKSVHAF